MLSELADQWYYQNTFNCCVLFQVEQLTIALNSFTGMLYLCVILNCSSVTLPCYSQPIILRYTEFVDQIEPSVRYINSQFFEMFSTQKKKRMFTFTENFDDLQKSFKICSYKAVVYVEKMDSGVY